MKRNTKIKVYAVVVTIVLVSILLTQIRIIDVIATLRGIKPFYLFVGFLLYIGIYLLRALRFYILLNREVGLRDLFNIVCVHNMVNNILPARTGEFSYVYLLNKLHNKKAGESFATLVVVRGFDLITISVLFIISVMVVQNLPEIMMRSVWLVGLFLVFVTSFILLTLYFNNSFMSSIKKLFELLKFEKYDFLIFLLNKTEEMASGFENIKNSGKFAIVVLILTSFGIWFFLYLLGYVLLVAMNITLPFFTVLFASTFAVITTVLPIQGIGGFGTMEGGWAIGFIAIGLTKEVAISSGFSYHIIIFTYLLILGFYGFLKIKLKKNVQPNE